LRCTGVGARVLRVLRATCIFVRHFFLWQVERGNELENGGYSPPHREIYLRSPASLFLCHNPPTNSVNGEPKAKYDGPQCDLS